MTALPYAAEEDRQLRILGIHRSRLRPGEIGVDLFAGGGGYSEGYQWAVGMPPAVAVNHDANAIAMHTLNHPETEHYLEDVFHVDPFAAVRGRPVGVLHGSPDCFPAGTLILTEHGYRPIQDLRVGDLVLTHRNRWRKVTATMSSFKATRTIRGYGHPGLPVSYEHPFWTVTRETRRTFKHRTKGLAKAERSSTTTHTWSEPTWRTASELTPGMYWATPRTFEPLPIPPIGGRGLAINEQLMWLVGRYLADGCTRLTENRADLVIVCGSHEAERLLPRLAAAEWSLRWQQRNVRTGSQFITAHRGFVMWLREHFGHLAHGKTLPGWVYGMPPTMRAALLDGYMSGDGWNAGTFAEVSTVSRALAFSVRSLATSLGYAVTVYHPPAREASGVIEGRRVNTRSPWQLRWRHVVDEQHRQHHENDMHQFTPIREVTNDHAQVKVFNISVDEDESYITEGIIGHNCTHFSRAKGDVPKSKKIRGLAWVIIRWAAEVSPRIISLENVEEFMTWGPLDKSGSPIKSRAGETFRAFVDALSTGLPAGHPAYDDMRYALVGDEPVPCMRHPRRRRRACEACTAFATSDYPRMPLDRYDAIVARCVEGLGYDIAWRSLRGSDYGAPTSRKRLFIVGRRDGEPVRWPAPTHGPKGVTPYRTAADCIEWSDLGVSIFLTEEEARAYGVKRPLAEATQRRIAEGIRRYVLDNPRPFLVNTAYTGTTGRGSYVYDPAAPLTTITATRDGHALVTPTLMSNNTNNAPHAVDEPLGTITTGNRHFAVAPLLTPANSHGFDADGGAPTAPADRPMRTVITKDAKALIAPQLLNITHQSPVESLEKPLRTITAAPRGEKALVAPVLARTAHGEEGRDGSKRRGRGAHPVDEALPTVTGSNDIAIIAPTLIQTSYGEREGQAPRVLDLHEPLGTVVAGGTKHGLVETFLAHETDAAAFMVRNNTGMVGRELTETVPTVCARETMSLGVAHVTKFNTGSVGSAIDEPLPTITGGGGSERPAGAAHGLGVVTAHIITHNGQSTGAPADAPLPTITAGGMGHQGVVAAHVTKFNGTSEHGAPIDDPLHTVTSGGNRGGGHLGMAAVHLEKFYGEGGQWQGAEEPLHTVTTKDRIALVAAFLRRFNVITDDREVVTVSINGETFVLYDIAMRMLQPRELARAQGFPDTYKLVGTKSQQVARIGNSVVPQIAAAIVRANLDREEGFDGS